MKIIVLTGSNHKNGTSNTLVDEFIKGAKENDNEIVRFDTGFLDIHHCIGCGKCGMDGDCVFQDDMVKILDEVESADMVLFASPIYYFTVTAPLKAAIDRFYSRNNRIASKKLKTAFITTCADSCDSNEASIIAFYKKLVDFMNYQDMGMIIGRGCPVVEMMPKELLEEAYNLGKKIK